jgi:LuxR family transcriptional regulator, maltose regulon positive regulatory protein
MAMTLFLHDPLEEGRSFDRVALRPLAGGKQAEERIHLLREKIEAPAGAGLVRRPRLDDLVERSLSHFAGTLISGRSGTGKTGLAVQLAERYKKVAWYTLDALDADWGVFKSYFAAAVAVACGGKRRPAKIVCDDHSDSKIAQFLVETFAELPAGPTTKLLIVIDDLHHIFDAPWFGDFFQLLLFSLPSEAHLLLLCRSKPPSPLWRLRSKQVLNVIDERLLAFTGDEAADLLSPAGLSETEIQRAWKDSFGQVSKLAVAPDGR